MHSDSTPPTLALASTGLSCPHRPTRRPKLQRPGIDNLGSVSAVRRMSTKENKGTTGNVRCDCQTTCLSFTLGFRADSLPKRRTSKLSTQAPGMDLWRQRWRCRCGGYLCKKGGTPFLPIMRVPTSSTCLTLQDASCTLWPRHLSASR